MQDFAIDRAKEEDDLPFDLLLLADPSESAILQYLPRSSVFLAKSNKEVVGVYVLYPIDNKHAEIKNIAVAPRLQGKGIGQALLKHATEVARAQGFEVLLIGTGNSSLGQLSLYQKMGFEPDRIVQGFFLENYPEPIFENGLQCKHLVMLKKVLV